MLKHPPKATANDQRKLNEGKTTTNDIHTHTQKHTYNGMNRMMTKKKMKQKKKKLISDKRHIMFAVLLRL